MLSNPDFLLPGQSEAEALDWTRTVTATGLFAGYVDAYGVFGGAEGFAWVQLAVDLTPMVEMLASFDARGGAPKLFEDFEDLWGARHARLLSKKEAPFVLQPGQTLLLRVNAGPVRTVTFQAKDFANIADARAEEIARVIDRAIEDADAFMAPGGRGVVIATTAQGYASTLEVTGGTAASILDFPPGLVRGQDEEGGTFFKRAEFDLMNDAVTGAEFEDFEGNFLDARVTGASGIKPVPDLRYDPHDKLARFTLVPADPFIPDAFLASLDTYSWSASTAEAFDDVTFGALTQ